MDKLRTTVAGRVVSAAVFVGITGYEDYKGAASLDSVNVAMLDYGSRAGERLGDTTITARALILLHGDVSEHDWRGDGRDCLQKIQYGSAQVDL